MTSVDVKSVKLPVERKLFIVAHEGHGLSGKSSDFLVIPEKRGGASGPAAQLLITEQYRKETDYNGDVVVVESLPRLDDGDIVLVDQKSKRLEVLFQVQSSTNSLYVTNACNSRCQFCPQPSTPDDGLLFDDANAIINLVDSAGECVNVTGGEPTLCRNRFVGLLKHAAEKWPQTKLFVLTNGRVLADDSYVDEIMAARGDSKIGFGVPLYSDSAYEHNKVVGVPGAFGQTIKGLYNLSRYRAEIEIRVVISKLTYRRLPDLIGFVGRNIPFVTRIAVMGLEPMGYCRERWDDFWIDPADSADCLCRAADVADNFGLTMLLYNFQLCCLPEQLRPLACSSISEWKRVHVDKCWSCEMRHECGGLFASQNEARYLPRILANGL